MDRIKAKMLRKAIEMELKEVEENLKVKIEVGRCTYNDSNCTFKLEIADIGKNGEVKSKEVEEFIRYASNFGLNADDLGKQFNSNGEIFKITGLSVRKRKYPILGVRLKDGKRFKFAVEQVITGLKYLTSDF